MRLGYNTNGFAHHSLPAAIELMAALGYESVAITLDYAALNPYAPHHDEELEQTAELLQLHNLRSVVETGARFLLDPWHKHEPTLLAARDHGRPRRVEFLRRAIDVAAALGSDCVSLWAGVLPPGIAREQGMQHLVEGLHAVIDYADRREVRLGFEPEPGMLIDTMDSYAELLDALDDAPLDLTLDVGHLHCLGERPIADIIVAWAPKLVNVHIEDMRFGVHEHLMFGDGEMEFAPIIDALQRVAYDGGVHVELSRHSHLAPLAARQAFGFLQPLLNRPQPVAPSE
ncbi:MAG: sugar phosphate isomerase/epimerase [Planctomycetales bacterium]|nr:sugar phosphate isomerase/epimerase [Planctomycetales bacterium]